MFHYTRMHIIYVYVYNMYTCTILCMRIHVCIKYIFVCTYMYISLKYNVMISSCIAFIGWCHVAIFIRVMHDIMLYLHTLWRKWNWFCKPTWDPKYAIYIHVYISICICKCVYFICENLKSSRVKYFTQFCDGPVTTALNNHQKHLLDPMKTTWQVANQSEAVLNLLIIKTMPN